MFPHFQCLPQQGGIRRQLGDIACRCTHPQTFTTSWTLCFSLWAVPEPARACASIQSRAALAAQFPPGDLCEGPTEVTLQRSSATPHADHLYPWEGRPALSRVLLRAHGLPPLAHVRRTISPKAHGRWPPGPASVAKIALAPVSTLACDRAQPGLWGSARTTGRRIGQVEQRTEACDLPPPTPWVAGPRPGASATLLKDLVPRFHYKGPA